MIKQTITYTDFDDNTVSEDHYFHLSKSEIIEMELSVDGGLAARLTRIGNDANGAEILATFKMIIAKSYGQRDPANPSKFFKSDGLSEEFMSSLAFDAFLGQILTDPSLAITFVNGVIPKDLAVTPEVSNAVRQALGTTPDTINLPSSVMPAGSRPVVPDPNSLDVPAGNWPRTNPVKQDLPWANREPTEKELMTMSREDLSNVYQRKAAGWRPSQ